MPNEKSDLLTDVDLLCWNAEVLAMKNLHAIELPLCGFLTRLSAKDCIDLLRYMLNDSKSLNQPTMETMLVNYFITDYISCGFSSPNFHTIFHKNLQADDGKRLRLIKLLIRVWKNTFKHYAITNQNVEFIKDFIVSLERLFIKITNLIPEGLILLQKNVLSKIKKCLINYEKKKEKKIRNSKTKTVEGVENEVPKKSIEPKIKIPIQNQKQQSMEKNPVESMKCLSSNNELQKRKVEPFSDKRNFLKKPKLMSNNDLQNVLNQNTKSDLDNTSVQPPGQKLNAFQVMMLNAKKRKSIVK